MKLAILNPVVELSEEILSEDAAYIKKYLNDGTEFDIVSITSGFRSIDTAAQGTINGAKVIDKVIELQDKGYDGIFVHCFDDPGVMGARELSKIPVMGAYITSMHYALALYEKIAIISTDKYGVIGEQRKAQEHGIDKYIAAIENVDMSVLELSDDVLAEHIKTICFDLEKQDIYAAVLGCTGMYSVADMVREELKEAGCRVQLIEPFKMGMKMLELVVGMKDINLIRSTPIDLNDYIR